MQRSIPSSLQMMRRALFLVSVPIFFISFALPLHARELGASAVQIGALFSLFTICLLVLRPLVGLGLDRIGRRPFFLLALAMYIAANATYAFADALALIYCARFLQGLGASVLLISVDTITTDLSEPDSRAITMGQNIESQARGSLMGAFIGISLIGSVPIVAWQWSFASYAIMGILGLVFAWFYVGESLPRENVPVEPVLIPDSASDGDKPSTQIEGLLARWLMIVMAAGFANALINPIYLIFLQDRFDVPMVTIAWAFLPAGIVYAIAPSRLGRLARGIGPINALIIGYVGAGVLYLALPSLPGFWSLAFLYTLSAFGWALADPARNAITALFANSNNTGRTFGTVDMFVGIGGTIGPVIGGYLYDTIGHAVPFYLNGVLLFCTALLAQWMLKPRYKLLYEFT